MPNHRSFQCLLFQFQHSFRIFEHDLADNVIREIVFRKFFLPSFDCEHRPVTSEQHLVLKQSPRILHKRGREILRRPAGHVDEHVRFVHGDGKHFIRPRPPRMCRNDRELGRVIAAGPHAELWEKGRLGP
jgi:hypothetical protein